MSSVVTGESKHLSEMAGTIINGALLAPDILKNILSTMDADRTVAMGVHNKSGTKWTAASTYLDFATTSDVVLPQTVDVDKAFLYSARRVSGLLMMGIFGVATYDMANGNTLAIMFAVPYNCVLYSSWWNVHVYKGKVSANIDLYSKLYSSEGNPIKGDDSWHAINDIGKGYKARGSMSSSRNACLLIDVEKKRSVPVDC